MLLCCVVVPGYDQQIQAKVVKSAWVHKTGRFVHALYARGRGPHYAHIRTENSSSKLNFNISVLLAECCFSTEPAFVRNLFQNGYPSTFKDMLIYSIQQPEHCFQFKYLEFHSNQQTFNVGLAYCQLTLHNKSTEWETFSFRRFFRPPYIELTVPVMRFPTRVGGAYSYPFNIRVHLYLRRRSNTIIIP